MYESILESFAIVERADAWMEIAYAFTTSAVPTATVVSSRATPGVVTVVVIHADASNQVKQPRVVCQ
jgi:hypothetical protein